MSRIPPARPTPLSQSLDLRTGRGLALSSLLCGLITPLVPLVQVVIPEFRHSIALVIPSISLLAIVLGIMALVKLSKPGQVGSKGAAFAGVGLGLVELVCLSWVYSKSMSNARRMALHIESGRQMSRIVQGMVRYAEDNKGWFPPKGSDWRGILVRGGYANESAFTSPLARAGQWSYNYASPGEVDKLGDPSRTIVLVENPEFFVGTGNVCAADARVLTIGRQEFWSVVGAVEFDDGTRLRPPDAGAR